MNYFTVIAIDSDTSDSTSRTFNMESEKDFIKEVEEWEEEIPYRKYELTHNELLSDYPDWIEDALDELEIC